MKLFKGGGFGNSQIVVFSELPGIDRNDKRRDPEACLEWFGVWAGCFS